MDNLWELKGNELTQFPRPFVNKIESGTKSFARLAEKEATKNNRVQPTRGKLYQISRTRKDGSIVNDKAAQFVDPTANSNLSDILRSMIIEIPANFSPGQNNSINGNQGNSNQGSSVADQTI
ncbi:transposase, Ptta/En/Spm, partial [Tanacetum coccineum]